MKLWTREFGSPGEVDEAGRVQMIDVGPKPYQKPHPPLFPAFSMSAETVRWCAREGIAPSLLIPLGSTYCRTISYDAGL